VNELLRQCFAATVGVFGSGAAVGAADVSDEAGCANSGAGMVDFTESLSPIRRTPLLVCTIVTPNNAPTQVSATISYNKVIIIIIIQNTQYINMELYIRLVTNTEERWDHK